MVCIMLLDTTSHVNTYNATPCEFYIVDCCRVYVYLCASPAFRECDKYSVNSNV